MLATKIPRSELSSLRPLELCSGAGPWGPGTPTPWTDGYRCIAPLYLLPSNIWTFRRLRPAFVITFCLVARLLGVCVGGGVCGAIICLQLGACIFARKPSQNACPMSSAGAWLGTRSDSGTCAPNHHPTRPSHMAFDLLHVSRGVPDTARPRHSAGCPSWPRRVPSLGAPSQRLL